jgi:rhodanese-related sulfurtransferase
MPQTIPTITPSEAAAATEPSATPDPAARPLIVDVRERDEFTAERVEGVVLLPISEFVARHQELPKDRPLLMLCAAGSRSASATMFLRQHADSRDACPTGCGQVWTDVRNITGGMIGWRQAGLPVLSGTPAPGEGDLPG